jgi:hypothetical protein
MPHPLESRVPSLISCCSLLLLVGPQQRSCAAAAEVLVCQIAVRASSSQRSTASSQDRRPAATGRPRCHHSTAHSTHSTAVLCQCTVLCCVCVGTGRSAAPPAGTAGRAQALRCDVLGSPCSTAHSRTAYIYPLPAHARQQHQFRAWLRSPSDSRRRRAAAAAGYSWTCQSPACFARGWCCCVVPCRPQPSGSSPASLSVAVTRASAATQRHVAFSRGGQQPTSMAAVVRAEVLVLLAPPPAAAAVRIRMLVRVVMIASGP